jgi:pilus assembly protein TadC
VIAAALLIAAAILLGAGPAIARRRAGLTASRRPLRRERSSAPDPFAAASALDTLSVCLSAGMTVPAAAGATAASAPPALGALLRHAADLLALGADPDTAWQTGDADDSCAALARLARRSADSGSALAVAIAELAEQERQGVSHRATAAAERAGVLIAGPLGLCFLPAFVCLGVVPVVAGLAGDIFGAGMQ